MKFNEHLLINGKQSVRVDPLIRIVDGEILRRVDSSKYGTPLKEITPQLIKKINRITNNSRIFKYKKSFYVLDLVDFDKYPYLKEFCNQNKSTELNQKLSVSFYFDQPENFAEDFTVSNGESSLNKKNAEELINFAELAAITQDEANDFLQELKVLPFFAIKTASGQKIYELLKKDINNAKEKIEKNRVFYRSRKWIENQTKDYSVSEVWTAPFGKPSQGRFNTIGIPYLYISESLEILKKEIRMNKDNKRTSIELKNKMEYFVLDLTKENNRIFDLCKIKNDDMNSLTYNFPNFLSQCLYYMKVREGIKIDGIKYFSVQNLKNENYINYVLFENEINNFKFNLIPNDC